jgi:hypothetical protein
VDICLSLPRRQVGAARAALYSLLSQLENQDDDDDHCVRVSFLPQHDLVQCMVRCESGAVAMQINRRLRALLRGSFSPVAGAA